MLSFHARRAEVRDRFMSKGATPLSLPDLGRISDMLLVVVGDEHDVRNVVVESGLLDAMRPGAILVIHSSIPPDAVRALASQTEMRGVHLLDAPVSGGRDRSYAGDLTILVGGEPAVVDAVRPVMTAYASRIVRVGPAGSGQRIKSLNNYFYAAHLATAAKMIELIRAFGLDIEAAAEALPLCSGSSAAFAMQARHIFERTQHDKGVEHAMDLLTGVVESLRASARSAGVDLGPIDRLVDQGLAGERARAGIGKPDFC
ncbi:NAD-binding of NADP-dependent 3-hydroxyisobutyrate dehydrogenase [Sphingobium faniae]|nr:NAD-binding of NADP-dependent 3-hydroxyisobutyrate dehydrogenase [Sphingobium faniae]